MRFSTKTARGLLGIILVVALSLRLGWVSSLPSDEQFLTQLPDQLEYLALGRNLVAGEGLKFYDPDFRDEVHAFRMPGYPLLIAAMGGSIRAVRVAHSIIDTSTVLAVYFLARRWLDRGAGLFAALLVAVNPYLIFFCGLILSETLFAAMLTWGMALIVFPGRNDASSALRRRAWSLWWAGAIVLALSVLVRPSALLLPVVLGTAAAVANRRQSGPYLSRWTPPVAATMLLLTVAVLLPWGYRNYRVLGTWVFTTTNTGITLYDGFNPDATGGSNQTFIRRMPQLREMNETQRSKYLADRAWQYVQQHPRRAVELMAMKLMRTWSPAPLSREYGTRRNLAVALTYMIPFYLLILYGLWFGTPATSAKVFLMIPAIYFTAVHAVSVGSLRYRVPSDVPMAVLAAASLSQAAAPGRQRALPVSQGEASSF